MKQYSGAGTYQNVQRVTQEIIYLRVPDLPAGSVERVDIWIGSPFAIGSNAVFDVNLNGETLFASPADRPSIGIGATTDSTTGLAVEVERGDIITVDVDDLPQGGIAGPVFLSLTIEDGQEAGLTEAEAIAAVAAALVAGDGITIDDLTISATGGGGGAGTGGYYLAQAQPASPHAKNDEGNDPTLTGWTTWQAGDSTITVADSCIQIKQTSQGSYKLSGLFKTVPAGDFCLVTRIALDAAKANYAEGGIALFANATGAPNTTDIATFALYNAGTGYSHAGEEWADHNNYTGALSSYDASIGDLTQDIKFSKFWWLKVLKSGSTWKFYTAPDHAARDWTQRRSGTIPFGTVAEFGLFVYNNGTGSDATLYCDSFRVFTTDPFLIGGTA